MGRAVDAYTGGYGAQKKNLVSVKGDRSLLSDVPVELVGHLFVLEGEQDLSDVLGAVPG